MKAVRKDDDDDEVEQPKISEIQHPCGHPLLHLTAMNFAQDPGH